MLSLELRTEEQTAFETLFIILPLEAIGIELESYVAIGRPIG